MTAIGNADKKRISELERALMIIATWANCDASDPHPRPVAMGHIYKKAMSALGGHKNP